MTTRRCPAPWTVEQIPGGYKVLDATGQALTYIYAKDTKAQADIAKLPTTIGTRMRFAARCAVNLSVILLVFLVVLFIDIRLADERFLAEGPPRAESYFILRSGLAFVLALFVVSNIYRYRDPISEFETASQRSPMGILAASMVVLLALTAAALMAVNPRLYNLLALEDSVVEWFSAAALFAASALLLAAALTVALRGNRQRNGLLPALLLSGVFFVIGMEEISWMQRVLDVAPPLWLNEINAQKEMNLHNVFTNQTENAYYVGAFAFLVALPFVANAAPRWRILERFADFIPGRFVVVMGAMSTFAYGMWNIFWLQFSLFASLFILIAYSMAASRDARRVEHAMFLLSALALFVIQALVLATGSTQVRAHDDTEFREMFIAIAIGAYSIETAARLWRRADNMRVLRQTAA